MSDFKYEQGEKGCSLQNGDKCSDEFLYSTLSSWVGIGQEASAQIKLTPVPMSAPQAYIASESKVAAPTEIMVTPVDEQKEEETEAPVIAAGKSCQQFPQEVINVMIGLIALLVISIVAMYGYYLHAKKAKDNKATEEANKDFDAIVDNNQQ